MFLVNNCVNLKVYIYVIKNLFKLLSFMFCKKIRWIKIKLFVYKCVCIG